MIILGGTMLAILSVVAVWQHALIFSDWPMRTFGYSLLAFLLASMVLASRCHPRPSKLVSW
jgi:hypothetical protein